MNQFKVLLVASLLAMSAKAQEIHHYYPERPVPGDSVTFQYHSEYTILKGQTAISGTVYFFRHGQWEQHNITGHQTDSGWISRIYLPEATALIVPVLSAGGKTDRGGRFSYATLCSFKNGPNVPASRAAWGALRTPVLIKKGLVPKIVEDSAYIRPEVSNMWMENELKFFPQSRRHIFYYAMVVLQEYDSAKFAETLPKEADYIMHLPDVTENEMLLVSKAWRELAGDAARAAAVDKEIKARFPDGAKKQSREAVR